MNDIKFNNIRVKKIAKQIINGKKVDIKDIAFLDMFLTKFNKSNDSKNILKLINRYNLGKKFNTLLNEHKELKKNSLEIDNIEKELNIIFNQINKDRVKITNAINLIFNETKSNDNNYSLHRFIRLYDILEVLDIIYNSNNDIIYNKCSSIKELFVNKLDLVSVKIDYDLVKTNEFELNKYQYAKIIVYKYDSTIIYYLISLNDLIKANLKYSYDYNNYLSYLLDYKFKKYYDVFNNKDSINKGFKYIKTYNKALVKKIEKEESLKVNKAFKYSNDYYSFNDLFDLNLNLKYLDLDLNNYLKQLDLDLISLDNDIDYLSLLNKEYEYLNNLCLDLDLEYTNLKYDVNKYLNSLKTFKVLNKSYSNLNIQEKVLFKRTIANISYNSYISKKLPNFNFFNLGSEDIIYYANDSILNDVDRLNYLSNDIKILNDVLNILEFVINRYHNKVNNESYKKNYLTYERLNKHNTKNKNNDLEQIKNGNKNYCYDVNKNYFKVI